MLNHLYFGLILQPECVKQSHEVEQHVRHGALHVLHVDYLLVLEHFLVRYMTLSDFKGEISFTLNDLFVR